MGREIRHVSNFAEFLNCTKIFFPISSIIARDSLYYYVNITSTLKPHMKYLHVRGVIDK